MGQAVRAPRSAPDSLPHLPCLPHLQLDDGPELSPRRVSDHHQLALDDDGLRHVEALVRLASISLPLVLPLARKTALEIATVHNSSM